MTIVQHAYLIDWPQELTAIASAINNDNQEQFNQLVNSFKSSPEKQSYSSNGPDYEVHIDASRIVLPLSYYLLKWGIKRDIPPYDAYKLCNNTEDISDEDFNSLGILTEPLESTGHLFMDDMGRPHRSTAPETILAALSKKEKVLKMMVAARNMFNEVSADNLFYNIPTNPFNYFILQLEDTLSRGSEACDSLINTALEAGAVVDANTLFCIKNVGDYWFNKFNKMLPADIKLRPDHYFSSPSNAINYGTRLDISQLISLDRLQHDIPEGETSWVHKLSGNAQALNTFVEEYRHNINHRGIGLATPLMEAINKLETSTIERLLKMGADPNIADKDGNTSLHYAAPRGVKKYVSILISAGADPSILNNENKIPKDLANESNMGRKNIPILDGDEELMWTI